MNQFYFIAIMLYALQRDLISCPIIRVLYFLDAERGNLSREDYLKVVYSDAMMEHDVYNVSFGIYDKYLKDKQFSKPALPF